MASPESEAARIFLEAVEDHEPGQWDDFVRKASASDPVLLKHVDAVLRAHEQSNPMLDAGRLLATADIPVPNERPGATIVSPSKAPRRPRQAPALGVRAREVFYHLPQTLQRSKA
jgi:hypothetical protein